MEPFDISARLAAAASGSAIDLVNGDLRFDSLVNSDLGLSDWRRGIV